MGITAKFQDGTSVVVGYVNEIVDGSIATTIEMDENANQIGTSITDTSTGKTTSKVIVENSDGSYSETISDTQYEMVDGSTTETVLKSSVTVTSFSEAGAKTGIAVTKDGVERTYNESGTLISEGASSSFIASLDIVASDALTAIPTSIKAVSGDTKLSTAVFDGGDENTYYDASGSILGYSFTSTEGNVSSTSYQDADRNSLGGSDKDTETGWESSNVIVKK